MWARIKINLFRIFILQLLMLPLFSSAQIVKETKEQGSKGAVSSRVQRKAAKQKWKEQRALERDQKKEIKLHDKRLQTKKTRKRMADNRKKSEKLRTNKRESFFVRLFKYKH